MCPTRKGLLDAIYQYYPGVVFVMNAADNRSELAVSATAVYDRRVARHAARHVVLIAL